MQIFNKKVNNLVKNGIKITFYKKNDKMVEKFDTINVRKKMVDLLKKIYMIRRDMNVVRGRVKWFNNEKGYGFIEFTDKEDIFVHYSAINQEGYKTLQEGQYVEFNLLETSKGYQALNVSVVKSEIIV